MKVLETGIEGLKLVEPEAFRDGRGYFCETYSEERYAAAGMPARFVQTNESLSAKGVRRGLHWQAAPHTQAKLVRVVRGAAWDVAVDIRKGSPTYGRHFGALLTGRNMRQLYIPRGFAHGFAALEDDTLFNYMCDNPYRRESERGMRLDDPALGIEWPDAGAAGAMSEKDLRLPAFDTIDPWEETEAAR